MADTWSMIGVILGIIFVFLLVSSMQVDDERQDSRSVSRYYNEEDNLLEDRARARK